MSYTSPRVFAAVQGFGHALRAPDWRVIVRAIAFAFGYYIVQRLTGNLRFSPIERAAIWLPGAVLLTALRVGMNS